MKYLLNKQSILEMNSGMMYEPLEYHGGGGGGDKTSTQTSGFSKEYAPDIKALLGQAKGLYESGELSKVAGLNADQEAAFGTGREAAGRATALEQSLANNANISYGDSQARFTTDAALNRGADMAGATGNLGGSRNAFNNAQIHAAGQSAYNAEKGNLMSNALQVQGIGAEGLGKIGMAQQQQTQNQLDAKAKGIERYGNVFGNFAGKESTTTSTGGGK